MNIYKTVQKEDGYVVSVITIFVLVIMVTLAVSMASFISIRQHTSTNAIRSTQSYYAAESGVEDALMRLYSNPNITSTSYNFAVGNATTSVTIPDTVNYTRTITSQGTNNNITRKLNSSVTFGVGGGTQLYYGVQADTGGFTFGSGAQINGNVISNGFVKGNGTITGTVVVTGNNTGLLQGNGSNSKMTVSTQSVGGAVVYGCTNSIISNSATLRYVAGQDVSTCTASIKTSIPNPVAAVPLPISDAQITAWKNTAAGACNAADVNTLQSNNKSVSMGSCTISGNVNVGNSTKLTLTGTLYITGNLNFGNTDIVSLSSSYGSSSGYLITDGAITMGNSGIFSGSGQSGSYVVLLSTASGAAITMNNGNTFTSASLYAGNGKVTANNSMTLHQITAKEIVLGNNVTLNYEVGAVSGYFGDGPGGSIQVQSWSEQ